MRFLFGVPLLISLSLVLAPEITIAAVVELVEEAQSAQNDSNYDEAEKLWRQVIKQQPRDALAYARLGSVLFSQNRIDEGIAAYQQAIKIKPSAKIYNSYGDNLRSEDKLTEALGAYQEALKLDSKSEVARSGLGTIYLRQENYTQAVAEFRHLVALKPDWNNYESLGDALTEAGKHDEARTAYRQAIKLEPTYYSLYNKVAESFQKQEKFNDAILAYRQAINVDSTNFYAYTGLAELIKFPKSIMILTEYAKQKPKNEVPLQALGYIYKQNKKLNESVAAYRQAIKVKPSAENYSSLGEVLVEQNKLDEAVAAYRQTIKLEPQDYRYGALAEVLIKQNKLNEALTSCQTVIDLYKGKDTSYINYYTCSVAGFGIYQNQGLKNVMTTFQQLTKKIPSKNMAEIYVNLGYRIQSTDNFIKEDAIAIFEEALKFNPRNKEAQENLQELQQTQQSSFSFIQ
ncbi:hypothetical protein CAL7716_000680 [Calothrix sp. PCC 7716]|nr:hypothetical protein CAL7716_000680 [Calothrix sp. PCC 7716]